MNTGQRHGDVATRRRGDQSCIVKYIIGAAAFLLLSFVGVIAQTAGTITGRVVTEDGDGMANVTVRVFPVGVNQPSSPRSTYTDEEGNFRFTGLTPRLYSLSVSGLKGFVRAPVPTVERATPRYYRTGENVSISLIRGGVITGRVTDARGEPVIGIQVTAQMVRDAEGNPVRSQQGGQPRVTDDRGIYRIYGLLPGTYLVVANGNVSYSFQSSPYAGEVPTYYPSSTRDTAAEVNVSGGGEVTGADIRYRNERGYAISGKVSGAESIPANFSASVTLYNAVTGIPVGFANTRPYEGNNNFAIFGLLDGEYEITSFRSWFERDDTYVSQPQRVSIKGSDLTGIELKLAPMSSISGKVVFESSPAVCESKTKNVIEEILLIARRYDKAKADILSQSYFGTSQISPTEKGEFTLRNLIPNRYHIETNLPNENWYLKSLTIPAPSSGQNQRASRSAANIDASRSGISVKPGEKITGVTLTLADGAAALRGKVIGEKEETRLPSRIRAHLVPSEMKAADEINLYAETLMRNDGTFNFSNLASGKYWLIARPVPEDEASDRPSIPVSWDATERAKLRKDAEAKKIEIELKPCQRLSDQILKY